MLAKRREETVVGENRTGDGGVLVSSQVFPIGGLPHFLIVGAALLVGSCAYQLVSLQWHAGLHQAILDAQVVCNWLSSFPDSGHFDCGIPSPRADNDSAVAGENSPSLSDVAEAGKTEHLLEPLTAMTPRDLVTLMVEAGVSEADDFDDPNEILSLSNRGAGAWIATAIIDTKLNGVSLARLWVTGKVPNRPPAELPDADPSMNADAGSPCIESETVSVSTLTGLVALYRRLGRTSTADSDGECFHPVGLDIRRSTGRFASDLSGPHPSFWKPWQVPDVTPPYLLIKRHMAYPWGHYATDVLAPVSSSAQGATVSRATLPTYEYERIATTPKQYYRSGGAGTNQSLQTLSWFENDPVRPDAALAKVSDLVLNEILRNEEVKRARFFFQAWRGIIQWFLVVVACYLVLLMLWRLTATFTRFVAPRSFLLQPPLAVVGAIKDLNIQAFQSRRFVDQWINSLPLIGLFGTVLGILFGLPNVSGAITAKGPSASASVNALFEQLGLAFSTTALAVFFVIIFQLMWEFVQWREDVALERIQRGECREYEEDHVFHRGAAFLAWVKDSMGFLIDFARKIQVYPSKKDSPSSQRKRASHC